MRIGIMQPYFFPYLGYFSLISLSDQFILFDKVQFIRHGWIERNRIVGPQNEPIYIKIPLVKHVRETLIQDIKINNSENWRAKINAQLTHYKKKAPYYTSIIGLVNEALSLETDSIGALNLHSLKVICKYIGLKNEIVDFSELSIETPGVNEPDEWALEISKMLKADEYINPIGGLSFFNKEKYNRAGIGLKFVQNNLAEYRQISPIFHPALSIIDVLMFNEPKTVMELINDYKIVE